MIDEEIVEDGYPMAVSCTTSDGYPVEMSLTIKLKDVKTPTSPTWMDNCYRPQVTREVRKFIETCGIREVRERSDRIRSRLAFITQEAFVEAPLAN